MIFGLCFIAGFAQNPNKELSLKILKDSNLDSVQHLALEVMKKGFNAGDGYREVWIRDYNTFITLGRKSLSCRGTEEKYTGFLRNAR